MLIYLNDLSPESGLKEMEGLGDVTLLEKVWIS